MTTPSTGEPERMAGSPTTLPPSAVEAARTRWRHAGGDSDGECDACWAELDIDEAEPRSDPHEAAPDAYQLANRWEAQFCGICGHTIEEVPA